MYVLKYWRNPKKLHTMFSYSRKIRLQETDAAGVLFFANYFSLFHEAFESFLEAAGLDLAKIIRGNEYLLPIAHAEADYTAPLFLGDTIEIKLGVEKIKKSSFVIVSSFIKNNKTCAAVLKTVHVSIDAKTRKKIPLPKIIRAYIGVRPQL